MAGRLGIGDDSPVIVDHRAILNDSGFVHPARRVHLALGGIDLRSILADRTGFNVIALLRILTR